MTADRQSISQVHGATITNTPIGTIRIWTGSSGIKKLGLEQSGFQLSGTPNLTDNKVIREATRQLEQYFSGELRQFDLPLDLSGCTKFQLRVFEQLQNIPYGQMVAYKDIAHAIGQPEASRSIGQALKANPIPVILPCHRVIRSDGTLGGYAGSSADNLQKKTILLQIEGFDPMGNTAKDTTQDEILSFSL